MRKNSYKFFQNKECEYFPCHKVDSGDELLQVNIGKLREDIWERMAQIASWEKMDKEMYREHRAKAIHNIATVLEKYKYLYHVPVLLQPGVWTGILWYGAGGGRNPVVPDECR